MSNEPDKQDRSWTEEIKVTGSELVDRIKELMEEGNVRRLIIRKPDGESLLEIPLTAGVAVGGVVTIMAPVLAAIGALAALIAEFKVEVVREDDDDESSFDAIITASALHHRPKPSGRIYRTSSFHTGCLSSFGDGTMAVRKN